MVVPLLMNRTLILGARGMLGTQLRALYSDAVAWDREDADVLDSAQFRAKVLALDPAPDVIVNCVAYNNVDGAEAQPDAAFALNGEFPGRLADLSVEIGAVLVHYSSNYVFDGLIGEYAEDAVPSPLSVYGQSKLEGERQIAKRAANTWYVLRTAVLFGPKGESEVSKRSFVDLMLDLAASRNRISAVSDEVNSVTYAPDLAAITRSVVARRLPSGIYHAVNSGEASWYDFACEIFRQAQKMVEVAPLPASQMPRKARRPRRAVLRNTKLPPVRPWQAALEECIREKHV
ncbi:MAG: dTDP-4-dehydrorhamnose reductase [Bryobacteraceae bacterium]